MKIIISPAKKMHVYHSTWKTTKPNYQSLTSGLTKQLKQYQVAELHDLMKISFKLSEQVYNYYHQDYNPTPALLCYHGTVYQQLSSNSYNQADLAYLANHLAILSSYYGILSYNSAITPYRLDMTMKLNLDLYQYWQATIDDYFHDEDVIISLASKEYAKMVKSPHLINIDFITVVNAQIKRNAMDVKKARGQCLELMIKNKIETLAQLKQLDINGYRYDDDSSTPNQLVFKRQAPLKAKKI